MADALCAADDFICPGHHFFGSLERGGVGKLAHHEKKTLVLIGNKSGGHAAETPHSQVQ